MKLLNIRGRSVNKNVNKYLIDWDKKSRSKIQFATKQFLRPYWRLHLCYEEFPCVGSLLKVDILNATIKVAIEVNGEQHGSFHYFHNGNRLNYLKSIKNDYKKSEWLELNGFQLIEINYDEIDLLSKEFFRTKFGLVL